MQCHGEPRSDEVDAHAFSPLLISLFGQAKLGLIKDMAQCRCYIGDLEVPMARCSHTTGLLLICLSQFSRRSRLPRVVENLRVPSPGTRTAYMLAPSRWHVNGYTWDPSGPLSNPDQVWPDLMFVTARVKHCFPHDDRRGVNSPDTWRNFLPKAIADRKIMLVDTRQLSNPEQDRGSREKNCIGCHPGIIDQLFSSGTGMYLIQSTWEAIEREERQRERLNLILS